MAREAGGRNRNLPMKLIERYLFRQLLAPTLAASVALAGVAVLSQSLNALDLIVDQGQSAVLFATITLLSLPLLLGLILPIALFVATLIALNRLHTEQEIVVCFASGLSRWRVVSPAVRLATIVALIVLILGLFAHPYAARLQREQLFKVRTDLAAVLVKEGAFNRPAPDLTVYAQRVERDGTIVNVFIHEDRSAEGPRTFTAKSGRIVKRAQGPVLEMRNGSSEEYDDNGVLSYLAFELNAFDLAPYVNRDEKLHFKISDRYPHELVFPDLRQEWERNNRSKMLAEAHGRLAAPLYAFTFVLLAASAVIGGQFSRTGYGRRIIYASAIAAVTRIFGFGVQSVCAEAAPLNVLQYAIPLGVAWAAYRDLFQQKSSAELAAKPRGGGVTELTPIGAPA